MVVDKILETVTEDGEEVYLLQAYYKGKLREYIIKDKETLTKSNGEMLRFGDCVEFKQNNLQLPKECYNNYNKDIAFNTSKTFDEQKGSFGTFRGEYNLTRGYVTDVNYEMRRLSIDNGITVNNGEFPTIALNRDRETSYVYIVDMGARMISVGDINSIEAGDYVVASINWMVKAITVYRD